MSRSNNEARRVAILQSCYVPWKGYFDIVGSVDEFVIYDDVQYSKNHWHNRNQIKTPAGTAWLTIPVSKADGAFPPIDHVTVAEPFAKRHWRTIEQHYARAPFMDEVGPILENLFEQAAMLTRLSEINILFMRAISTYLGFGTRFIHSRELSIAGGQTERLVNICRKLGATHYLSGPSAADYLQTSAFEAANIKLEWMDYSHYPPYRQLHGQFVHAVSIIDLLLNAGPRARSYMKAPLRPDAA